MGKITHSSRSGCALHGALKLIKSVDGFVPIIHSSAGCGVQSNLSENLLGESNRGWLDIPSTNTIEKQIIFGGTSRLREQIKNTIQVINGDLYVVITGCSSEIVGDDVPAMVKEGKEQGFPVTSIDSPGFKGDIYKGFELSTRKIIEEVSIEKLEVQKGLINILGIIPDHDLFWEGNLEELKNILESVGLDVNTLIGRYGSTDSWKNIGKGEVNLVLSPWGLEVAKYLKERFNTPYLYFGRLPVGVNDVEVLTDELKNTVDIDLGRLESLISQSKESEGYFIKKISETYFKYDLQKEIVIVGETSIALGISKFLQDRYGQIIKSIIITDNPDESDVRRIVSEINNSSIDYSIEVYFTEDSEEISKLISNNKPEIILGSSLEEKISKELDIPLLIISGPSYDKVVLNKTYTGLRGAINLIEDFSSEIIGFKN